MNIKLTPPPSAAAFALVVASAACCGFASVSSALRVDPGFAVDEPQKCKSTSDCAGGSLFDDGDYYCAQGYCIPKRSCLDHLDCYNPNNDEPVTKCKGYKYCDFDTLTCQHMCGESCPPGMAGESFCEAGETGCDNHGWPPEGSCFCVPTYCDELCSPLYFDCAGNALQDIVDPEFGVDAPPTFPDMVDPDFGVDPPPEELDPGFGVDPPSEEEELDPGFGVEPPPGYELVDPEFGVDPPDTPPQDCLDGACPVGDGTFCDWEGNCLLVGKCTTADDCFNEFNGPYPVHMCVGEIVCNNGLCMNDCDPIVEEFDCSNKDNAPNLVEVVCADKELSVLCDHLKDSKNKEVYKWLTDPKKRYTVFAPTNDAIDNLPDKYETTLKYHIAKGRASFARDLSCLAGNNLVTMSNGKDTRTKCKKDIPYIQQGKGNVDLDIYPEFVETDIIACNGLIHKLSNVIILKA